jgi:pimeloyl-ACP methyl ester carboxylesterase
MTVGSQKRAHVLQLVLLRGLGREARHWGEFLSDLAHAIPEARIITLDLPGLGEYSNVKSPLSISATTDFVRSRLHEKEAGERDEAVQRHLVAISLGGMVASDWLERYPNDFRSCVLINTSFRGDSPLFHRLRVEALKHLVKAAIAGNVYDREEHVLRMVSNRPEIYAKTTREWAKIQKANPLSILNFLRQLVAAIRFQPNLPRPPVPVLILNSEKDRMVHPTCSERIARRWGVEICRHPDAGHDLPLDDGPWVASRIHDFYQNLPIQSIDTQGLA